MVRFSSSLLIMLQWSFAFPYPLSVPVQDKAYIFFFFYVILDLDWYLDPKFPISACPKALINHWQINCHSHSESLQTHTPSIRCSLLSQCPRIFLACGYPASHSILYMVLLHGLTSLLFPLQTEHSMQRWCLGVPPSSFSHVLLGDFGKDFPHSTPC